MNAALQDYRLIWRAAILHRDQAAMRTLYLVAGAVVACGVIVAVLGDLTILQGLRLMTAVALMAAAFIWTFMFVPGSVRLNSPINAWLLPRQRRRLLQMTAAYWVAATLGIAFGLGNWSALPIVEFAMLATALMTAGNKYVPYVLMAVGNLPWLTRTVLPPAWIEWMTGSAAVWTTSILMLPAAAWGLRWLYPTGGDAYLARRPDQIKRVNHFAFSNEERQPVPEGMAGQGSRSFYRTVLRRDLRRADPGAMLMHALGPMAHWTAWSGGIAATVACGVVIHLVLDRPHGNAVQALADHVPAFGPAMLALLILFSTAQYGQQLRRTRGEQALLRLTPLAGDAALLNRRLASRLLLQSLGVWALLTVVIVVVMLPFAAGPDALLRQLALCCVAGQVAMMGLLGDYAGDRGGWNWMLGVRAAAYVLAQALVAMGLGQLTGTTAWPWLVEIPLIVCAVQLRLAWRRMLAAPPAFPAGRMD